MRHFPFVEFLEGHVTRIVVEGQRHYGMHSDTPPNDLIMLALSAGAWLHAAIAAYGTSPGRDGAPRDIEACVVAPGDWKGQVPKTMHHVRIASKLNFNLERSMTKKEHLIPIWPKDTIVVGNISPARAHHTLDACGLALWAGSIEFGYACTKIY